MSKKSRFSMPVKKQTLADQVATSIKESILAGEWEPGEVLPTEPELSEQFGVSRAVIRDATRMLAARGLVESQHGRGVFVTTSQTEAFADAFLLALRRAGASVWDVEQFEQMVIPEVCALASQEASDDEIVYIRHIANQNLEVFEEVTREHWEADSTPPETELTKIRNGYQALMQAIFDATHNHVWQLLATPTLRLRNLRTWQHGDIDVEDAIRFEKAYLHAMIDAIASRDPDFARRTVAELMQLPEQAELAMRQTPVGDVPQIPMALPQKG